MIEKIFYSNWNAQSTHALMTCSVLNSPRGIYFAFGGHDGILYIMNNSQIAVDKVKFEGWIRCTFSMDLDGDGTDELLVGSGGGTFSILKFDFENRTIKKISECGSNAPIYCCCAGDLDGNGKNEVVFGTLDQLKIFSNCELDKPEVIVDFDSPVTACCIGGLDIDTFRKSNSRLIVGTKKGDLMLCQVEDNKFDFVWGRELSSRINDIKISDTNYDGRNEIVVCTEESCVKILNAKGENVRDIGVEETFPLTALIDDIDRDGESELLVGCADGYLRVFYPKISDILEYKLKWKAKVSSTVLFLETYRNKQIDTKFILFGGYNRGLISIADFDQISADQNQKEDIKKKLEKKLESIENNDLRRDFSDLTDIIELARIYEFQEILNKSYRKRMMITSLISFDNFIHIQSDLEKKQTKKIADLLSEIKELKKEEDFEKALGLIDNFYEIIDNIDDQEKTNHWEKQLKNISDEIKIDAVKRYFLEIKERMKRNQIQEARRIANLALNLKEQIIDFDARLSLTTEVQEILQSLIPAEIDQEFSKIMELKELFKFDSALKKERSLLNLKDEVEDKNKREEIERKIKRIMNDVRISKIKKAVLSLGANYGKLEIREIAEDCGESKELITTIIKEMIKGEEIYAKYFESSKAVSFNQQKILENMERLKEVINPVVLPQRPRICVVCRGNINYLLFECPNCRAIYHLKCARELKRQGKACFTCHTSFPPLPEPPKVSDDPVVLSVKSISEKLGSFLDPTELMHKDLSSHFQSLKSQLKEELTHKLSRKFYEGFGDRIDSLFERFMVLDGSKMDHIAQLRLEQTQMFEQIQEKMEEFITSKQIDYTQEKVNCPHCGETILKEEDQQICEFCGGVLE